MYGEYKGRKVRMINTKGLVERLNSETLNSYLGEEGQIVTDYGEGYRFLIKFKNAITEEMNQNNGNLCFRLENIEFLDMIPTTKYKVGDKVRIKSDLVRGYSYGVNRFVKEMEEHRGKIMTIDSIIGGGILQIYGNEYKLKDSYWSWTNEMFDPYIENFSPFIAEFGCKVPDNDEEYELLWKYLMYLRKYDRI